MPKPNIPTKIPGKENFRWKHEIDSTKLFPLIFPSNLFMDSILSSGLYPDHRSSPPSSPDYFKPQSLISIYPLDIVNQGVENLTQPGTK